MRRGMTVGDPRFDEVRRLSDLSAHWLLEIENFFQNYKMLEDKFTEVVGWEPHEEAWRIINEGYERYGQH